MEGIGADGVVKAETGQHVGHLRPRSDGAGDAEEGEGDVPEGKGELQLQRRGPRGHVDAADEDEGDVGGGVVEGGVPVAGHPPGRLPVVVGILKGKGDRVVGRVDALQGLHQAEGVHDFDFG
mgnify:CR=1 FL=1